MGLFVMYSIRNFLNGLFMRVFYKFKILINNFWYKAEI